MSDAAFWLTVLIAIAVLSVVGGAYAAIRALNATSDDQKKPPPK